MAFDSIIKTKDKVIKNIIQNDLLVMAINPKDPDNIVNKHIFRYDQNPETLQEAETFLTIQVDEKQSSSRGKFWNKTVLIITIVSHEKHMIVKNIPAVTASRNDYIAMLLEKEFNGRNDFGYGQLTTIFNKEQACAKDYLSRRLIFETLDVNISPC